MHHQTKNTLLVLVTKFLALMVFIALGVGCQQQTEELVFSGSTMGSTYRVTVIAPSSFKAKDQLEGDIIEAMESVNRSMSTYLPDSELSQINLLPKDETVALSSGLNEVLQEAQRVSSLSDGAFDVTIGKAIRLWGFGQDGQITKRPSQEVINSLKQTIGYSNILLANRELTKRVDELEINLSAIAKGYAVDRVAQAIESYGQTDYLIDIGGDLRASGKNAKGVVWRVGVEKPSLAGGISQIVSINNQAIATSGDYRNFLVIDGKKYSHTIDPNTLEPVFHRLASVSVLHESAMTADALATAILSMGDVRGRRFAQEQSIAAYFIIRDKTGDNFKVYSTPDFSSNLVD